MPVPTALTLTPTAIDRAPRVLLAIRDRSDAQVQASFRAQLGSVPVPGLIGVSTTGNARAIRRARETAFSCVSARRLAVPFVARLAEACSSGSVSRYIHGSSADGPYIDGTLAFIARRYTDS